MASDRLGPQNALRSTRLINRPNTKNSVLKNTEFLFVQNLKLRSVLYADFVKSKHSYPLSLAHTAYPAPLHEHRQW